MKLLQIERALRFALLILLLSAVGKVNAQEPIIQSILIEVDTIDIGENRSGAPTATTLSATSITSNSATLRATINPNGLSTVYIFQYGTSTNYDNNSEGASLSAGNSAVTVSITVSGLSSGTTYHFRVRAGNTSGVANGSDKSFTTSSSGNSAPNTPSNPNPSSGSTGIATSRTFSWTCTDPNGDNVGYDLYMGTTSSNMTLKKSGSGTSAYISGLSQGQKYYWRIIAYDEHDASTTGPIWNFTTVSSNNPPNTPSNPNPSSGSTGIGTSRTFSWTCTDPDGDAVGYDLYMGTSSSNMTLKKSGSGTSAYISGLNGNQKYYWRIIAYDEDDASATGPIWNFTTVSSNNPPNTPSNPNPSSGSTGIATSRTFSWTCTDPDGDAVGYDLYMGTSSSNMTLKKSGSGTSAYISGLTEGQTYYWRIIAYDEDDASTTGPIWNFTTVSNQPPTTPSNPNPANGATGVSTSPSLSWTCSDPEGGSVGFDLYYGTSSTSQPNRVSGTGTSTTLSGLSSNQIYYWKVVAYDQQDNSSTSSIWHFTTEVGNQPPTTPSNPSPSDGATGVSTNPLLSWTCSDPEGGSVGFDLYYGTSSTSQPNRVSGTGTSTTLSGLNSNQTYYWKVVAYDQQDNSSTGSVWHFTTGVANCFDDCTSSSCGDYGNQMFVAAQYLCNLDIVEGIDYNLEPDISITRAQLAKTALYSLYNGPSNVPNPLVSDYFPSIYPDLQDNTTYYFRAAKALLYLEYGDGISPFDRDRSVFDPEGYIQRCFVLKVLLETFNIAPLTSGTNVFDDFGPSGYANSGFWGYAQKAYNLNIVQTTHFRPDDYCTRGEAFLYLYRILSNSNITKPTPVNTESPATSDFFIPTNLSPEVVNAMRGVEYGNFNYYNKDFFDIPGYMDLSFGINYNSYLTEMPDDFYPVKPLGKAWTHTYDMYMNIVTDAYNNSSNYVFHMQNGTLLIYNNNLLSVTEGNYYELTTSGSNKYILKSREQISYTFERQSASDGIYYLTQIKDRNNNAINIYYESGVSHYRIDYVETLNRKLYFYYTSNTDLISYVKDPINRKVYFYYNSDGQLTSLKDAKSQTSEFTYGTLYFEKGLLKSIKLPRGNHVYNNYQQRKLVSMSRISSTGNTHTDITISPNYHNGSSTSTVTENLTGSLSVTTTYTMNSKSRIIRMTSGSHTDVSYEYNITNKPDLVSKMTDNKTNVQTSYGYNSKGLPTTVTISDGSETYTMVTTYTELNDIRTYTDANGNITTYNYDGENGNLIGIVDALGHTTSIVNNSFGKPIQVTDPSGVVSKYTYNSYGNETKMSIPAINVYFDRSYDGVSRVTSAKTSCDCQTTTYTHDNNDNMLTETDALNHTTSYTYDANDNVIQITDANGNATDLTYDDNDFLTSVSAQGATRNYTYNRDGTIASFTNPNGNTFNYSYNSSGEMTSDGYASYSYNNKGQLSTVTKDNKAITYTYDGFGRVSSVAYDGKTVNYTYDNNDNILTITYPGNKTVTYTYDALNRMTSVKDWNNATTTYNYRNDGQLNYYQYPNGVRTSYSYDGGGRVVSQSTKRNSGNGTTVASYDYTWDEFGNHTQESFTEPYDTYPSIPTATISYSYNNANRLTVAGNLTFGYDNNGNTTSRTGRTYEYDGKNNLISVSGDFSATYTYDGLGNRRSATRGDVTRQYVLDLLGNMSNVLMETDVSGNAVCYYIYGASGLVSRIDASNNTNYYVYDYRGSTVAMIDATASANITHKYQYDDFGKMLQSEEANANAFRYVGELGVMFEDDALTFMRARYYDPEIGRFLSEDPIWNTNLYPYTDNNPVVNIDPEGTLLWGLIYHPFWSCDKMFRKEARWIKRGKDGKLEKMYNSNHYKRCDAKRFINASRQEGGEFDWLTPNYMAPENQYLFNQ